MVNLQTITKLLTIFLVATSAQYLYGGINFYGAGYVSTATLNDGVADYTFGFQDTLATSWNGLTGDQRNTIVTESPYWVLFGSVPPAQLTNLSNDLAALLNTAEQTQTVASDVWYSFAYRASTSEVFFSYVSNQTGTWASYSGQTGRDVDTAATFMINYAVPVSASVPEPSTAISLGLLGIVGFAGNRRRRRQESVA